VTRDALLTHFPSLAASYSQPTSPRKMLHPVARQALRQRLPTNHFSKRLASYTTESTQKKAADALSTAQATALRFLEGAQKALGPLGEKAGNLLGCTSPLSSFHGILPCVSAARN
jgi:hypothetical protein